MSKSRSEDLTSDLQSRSSRPLARCGCRRMKRGSTSPTRCTPRYRDNAGKLNECGFMRLERERLKDGAQCANSASTMSRALNDIRIRFATLDDAGLLLRLIR